MIQSMKWVLIIAFAIASVGCSNHSTRALHQSSDSSLPDNIGIQGYSPVSYFEKGHAERGTPQYSYIHKKRIYYFTSAKQVERFKNMPEAYAPKFGEYCPYSLALGRRVAIDPTNFKIHNGELLLFHHSVELATVDVPSQRDLFDEAENQFELLRF